MSWAGPNPPQIRFPFDEKKATAAAGLLIQLHGGRMEYFLLVKLLFLAEMESLKRRGWPISGDEIFAMERGPVPSNTLNLAKETYGAAGYWAEFIRRHDHDVTLIKDPDLGQLSESEIEILKEVHQANRGKHALRISNRLHKNYPDWKAPRGSRQRITFEEILRAVGKTEDEIAEIALDAKETAAIYELTRE